MSCLRKPVVHVKRICDFLERIMDLDAMTAAVDPALYRNRRVDSGGEVRHASNEGIESRRTRKHEGREVSSDLGASLVFVGR